MNSLGCFESGTITLKRSIQQTQTIERTAGAFALR